MEHGYDFQVKTEKNPEVCVPRTKHELLCSSWSQHISLNFQWIATRKRAGQSHLYLWFYFVSVSTHEAGIRPLSKDGVDEAWRVVTIQGHMAYRWHWHPHQAVLLPPISSSQHWQSPEDCRSSRGAGRWSGRRTGRRGEKEGERKGKSITEWLCLRKSASTCIQKPLVRPLFLTLFQSGGAPQSDYTKGHTSGRTNSRFHTQALWGENSEGNQALKTPSAWQSEPGSAHSHPAPRVLPSRPAETSSPRPADAHPVSWTCFTLRASASDQDPARAECGRVLVKANPGLFCSWKFPAKKHLQFRFQETGSEERGDLQTPHRAETWAQFYVCLRSLRARPSSSTPSSSVGSRVLDCVTRLGGHPGHWGTLSGHPPTQPWCPRMSPDIARCP